MSILSLSISSCDISNNEKIENITETQNIIDNKTEKESFQKNNFDISKINKNAENLLEKENYNLALKEFITILKYYTEIKDTL